MAVFFEQWYMCQIFGDGWWLGEINIASYADALALTKQLLALDRDIIRKIREHQSVIARITAEQILEHCPAASRELAQALTQRFQRVS